MRRRHAHCAEQLRVAQRHLDELAHGGERLGAAAEVVVGDLVLRLVVLVAHELVVAKDELGGRVDACDLDVVLLRRLAISLALGLTLGLTLTLTQDRTSLQAQLSALLGKQYGKQYAG